MSSYHGWTHRPKAQGGTDPIPGGDTLPYFEGYGDLAVGTPWTVDGEVPLDAATSWTNDTATFGFDTGAAEIIPSGVYFVVGQVNFGVSAPDTATISPDINIEIVDPVGNVPIDEGGGQTNWWKTMYMPPSFVPSTADEYRFIQLATFQQIYNSSGGQTLIPYVRASAGSADWEAYVTLHITRLGDIHAPFSAVTFFA